MTVGGNEPALKYFLSLSDEQQAEVIAVFRYIVEEKGKVSVEFFKKITKSIWEVRVAFRFLCLRMEEIL
jgi:hypothetical protein